MPCTNMSTDKCLLKISGKHKYIQYIYSPPSLSLGKEVLVILAWILMTIIKRRKETLIEVVINSENKKENKSNNTYTLKDK